jgi:hypothetical protein
VVGGSGKNGSNGQFVLRIFRISTPMHPKQQLELIIRDKVAFAVDEYVDGDWSRIQARFTLPRSVFDAWADGVELPYGRISRKRDATDGIYVLQDCEGWIVVKQEGGILLPKRRVFPTYKEAKREALSWEFLEILRGAV